jgi:hypothetical protein
LGQVFNFKFGSLALKLRKSVTNNAAKTQSSGQYYKLMLIVNDDSWVINRLEASLIDDARLLIYDHHMFIVQATGLVLLTNVLILNEMKI